MKRIVSHFYFLVLLGIFCGAAVGHFAPSAGVALKPIGDGFIALIRMLIAPLIFSTLTLGIARAGEMKTVGRVGAKALLYFEIVSTLSLCIGLLVGNLMHPGSDFRLINSNLDFSAVEGFAKKASEQSITGFILHIIPGSFADAFSTSGDLLQVILLSALFGFAANAIGKASEPFLDILESFSKVIFAIFRILMKLAPLGAAGAMAYTIGQFGIASLRPLLSLMACFYFTCALFVIFVLGPIAYFAKCNIFYLLRYLKQELITVLGTSSSESGLAPLMEKLERLGCEKSIVSLVVPTGYSFNLDGTNIYLALATLFVAQALNIPLTVRDQLTILAVAILTSKGASGVTGAGFITLAATFAVIPKIPVQGLALILGVDRFMSEARAITNFIGNAVAAIFISFWENKIDLHRLKSELSSHKTVSK